MVRKRTLLMANLALAGAALVAYRRWLGPRQRNWGCVDDESTRPLPGDDLVPEPNYQTTRAITVAACPEDIYPWLVQMGYRRGGLYSYDRLDRLFGFLDGPSAREVLPQFQHLEPGDRIPIGRGQAFPVRELVPNRAFILGGEDPGSAAQWTWQTVIEPIDDARTRLITRSRGHYKRTPFSRLFMMAMDMVAFVMTRRWLIVLKERAEQLNLERAGRLQEMLDTVTGRADSEWFIDVPPR